MTTVTKALRIKQQAIDLVEKMSEPIYRFNKFKNKVGKELAKLAAMEICL